MCFLDLSRQSLLNWLGLLQLPFQILELHRRRAQNSYAVACCLAGCYAALLWCM